VCSRPDINRKEIVMKKPQAQILGSPQAGTDVAMKAHGKAAAQHAVDTKVKVDFHNTGQHDVLTQ
jgi:hypothetical protein